MLVLSAMLPKEENSSADPEFISGILASIYFDIFSSTKQGSGKRSGKTIDLANCEFLLVAKNKDTMVRGLALARNEQILHKDSCISVTHGSYSNENKANSLIENYELTKTQNLLSRRGYFVYCAAASGTNKIHATDYVSGTSTSFLALSTLINNNKKTVIWHKSNSKGDDSVFHPSLARQKIAQWRKNYREWYKNKYVVDNDERTRSDRKMIESEWLEEQNRTMY